MSAPGVTVELTAPLAYEIEPLRKLLDSKLSEKFLGPVFPEHSGNPARSDSVLQLSASDPRKTPKKRLNQGIRRFHNL